MKKYLITYDQLTPKRGLFMISTADVRTKKEEIIEADTFGDARRKIREKHSKFKNLYSVKNIKVSEYSGGKDE